MGYYSKVAIAMKNEEAEHMVKEFLNVFGNDENKSGLFEEECRKHTGEKFTVFYWNDIKWYDSPGFYDDIHWVMRYLMDAIDTHHYYFIRIGEDRGDIEEIFSQEEQETDEIVSSVMCPICAIDFFCEFNHIAED